MLERTKPNEWVSYGEKFRFQVTQTLIQGWAKLTIGATEIIELRSEDWLRISGLSRGLFYENSERVWKRIKLNPVCQQRSPRRTRRVESRVNAFQPWTIELRHCLRTRWDQGSETWRDTSAVRELAVSFGRSSEAIREQLFKMGLLDVSKGPRRLRGIRHMRPSFARYHS